MCQNFCSPGQNVFLPLKTTLSLYVNIHTLGFSLQGYSRKGAALLSLDRLEEAEEAYHEGLRLDPNNQDTKTELEKLQRNKQSKLDLLTLMTFTTF